MSDQLLPRRPPTMRMLALAVALLGLALVFAVGSIVALWGTVTTNREDLHAHDDRIATQGRQIAALEAQVQALGLVPVTRQSQPPDVAPPVTTTTTTVRTTTTTEAGRARPAGDSQPTSTTPTSTTSTSTSTSTTLPPCLGGLPVGCVLPNGKSHPQPQGLAAVRSPATARTHREALL